MHGSACIFWANLTPFLLQALLEHGADVTVPAPNGFVPIHVAANHGRFEVFQMLLDAGADQGC